MDSPHGASVKARDFGLKGPRGWAFRGVGVDAEPGSLIAVEGPSGSGRTCLLLALTGRMKATEGHAEIGRHRLPKKMAAVRRIAALGPVPGVNDLDQALTVAEQLREGALLQRRYDGPVRALLRPRAERKARARARIDDALAAAGLDLAALPKGPRTSVRDLERLEAVRLSVAIALLCSPRLLALDDLDLKLSDAERAEAWTLLRSIAARGTTVLAVCSEAPDDAVVLRTGTPEQDAPAAPEAPAGPAAPPRGRASAADAKVTWGTAAKSGTASGEDSEDGDGSDGDGSDDDGSDREDSAGAPKAAADASADSAASGKGADSADSAQSAQSNDTENDDTKGADDAITEAGRA
ncbi:ATP-binding cassette domain-containing protein [Streptomyces sp. NPDC002044]|uniref:ATP-binding cassette domain-containing protein n=1 Tax=Streptomyces sp. NPDC002044 TaxID=3154662 RepID=UPI003332B84C